MVKNFNGAIFINFYLIFFFIELILVVLQPKLAVEDYSIVNY